MLRCAHAQIFNMLAPFIRHDFSRSRYHDVVSRRNRRGSYKVPSIHLPFVFAALFRAEFARWAKVVKEAGFA